MQRKRSSNAREVDQKLVESLCEELDVRNTRLGLGDLVHTETRPRVHGWIHIAEVPLNEENKRALRVNERV